MAPAKSGEKALLLRLIDEAYDKRAWHGTNLRGSIRGINANQAFFRPQPNRHNIWELVLHAAYWKYAVWRRLTGEKRGKFPRKGSNWLPMPVPQPQAWRDDVKLLDEQHRALREAIVAFPDKKLSAKAYGRYDYAGIIYGVATHDLYHAGQIQLIKRLYGIV